MVIFATLLLEVTLYRTLVSTPEFEMRVFPRGYLLLGLGFNDLPDVTVTDFFLEFLDAFFPDVVRKHPPCDDLSVWPWASLENALMRCGVISS